MVVENNIVSFLVAQLQRRGPLPFATEAEILGYRYLDCGHVDSFGIVVFVTEIEERFGVVLGPEELQSEEFRTVGGVARLIERLLESGRKK